MMFETAEKKTEPQLEPNPVVNFHKDLSTQLIASQSDIYADFKVICALMADGINSKVEAALIHFKREFQTYLLDKNVKVFSYLKESVELSIHEEAAVHKSRTMNNDLSRSVNRFLDVYIKEGKLDLDEERKIEFERQLKEVGQEMADVMRDERDSLFPIYDKQGHS